MESRKSADIRAHYAVKYVQTVSRVGLDPAERQLPHGKIIGSVLPLSFNDPLLKDRYQLDLSGAIQAWDVTQGDRTVPTYPTADADQTGYATMSGTSMASPFAAGTAGLIRSKHPDWKRDQVRKALEASAKDLGDKGYDVYYGNGRVDVLSAVHQ